MQSTSNQKGSALTSVLLGAVVLAAAYAFIFAPMQRAQLRTHEAQGAADLLHMGANMTNRMFNNNAFNMEQIAFNAYNYGYTYAQCAASWDCSNLYGNLQPFAGTATAANTPQPNYSLAFSNVTQVVAPTLTWPNGAPAMDGFLMPQWSPVNCGAACQPGAITHAPMNFLQMVYLKPQAGSLPLSGYTDLLSHWLNLRSYDPMAARELGYLYAASSSTNPAPAATTQGAVLAGNGMGGKYFQPLNTLVGAPSFPIVAAPSNTRLGLAPSPNNTGVALGQFLPVFLVARPVLDGLILGTQIKSASGTCPAGYSGSGTIYTTYETITQASATNGITTKQVSTYQDCIAPPPAPPATTTSGGTTYSTFTINTGYNNYSFKCPSPMQAGDVCQVTNTTTGQTVGVNVCNATSSCPLQCHSRTKSGYCSTAPVSPTGQSAITIDASGNISLTTISTPGGMTNVISTGMNTQYQQVSNPSQTFYAFCSDTSAPGTCAGVSTTMNAGTPTVNQIASASTLTGSQYSPASGYTNVTTYTIGRDGSSGTVVLTNPSKKPGLNP